MNVALTISIMKAAAGGIVIRVHRAPERERVGQRRVNKGTAHGAHTAGLTKVGDQ
jgi:hypothetical protein